MCGSIPASNSNNWNADESSPPLSRCSSARRTRARVRLAFARAPHMAALSPTASWLLEPDRVRCGLRGESRGAALVERQTARGALRRPSVFPAFQHLRGNDLRRRFPRARGLSRSLYQAAFRRAGQFRRVSAEPLLLRHAELFFESAEP